MTLVTAVTSAGRQSLTVFLFAKRSGTGVLTMADMVAWQAA